MEKTRQSVMNEEVVGGTEGGRSPTGVPPTTSAAATLETRLPEAPGNGKPIPDPAVAERPMRRRFTAEYKVRILREAERCTQPGQLGALLRREGLYASHLNTWRQQRDAGILAGLTPKRRGPKPPTEDPLLAENRRLRCEVERLTARVHQLEAIIEIQKKLSEALGFSLTPRDNCERQP
jgi:transposase